MLPYQAKFKFQADTVRLLIGNGADIAAKDETHSTPLHLAAFWGSAETVRLLIEHGADVTAHDGRNRTPLHLASSKVSPITTLLFV
jgi:ankyrin repeat protein